MNVIGRWIERWGDARMWMVMLFPAAIFVLVGMGGRSWSRRYDPGKRFEENIPRNQ